MPRTCPALLRRFVLNGKSSMSLLSFAAARERFFMGPSYSKVGNAFLGVLLIIVAAVVGSAVYTKKRTKSKTIQNDGIDSLLSTYLFRLGIQIRK